MKTFGWIKLTFRLKPLIVFIGYLVLIYQDILTVMLPHDFLFMESKNLIFMINIYLMFFLFRNIVYVSGLTSSYFLLLIYFLYLDNISENSYSQWRQWEYVPEDTRYLKKDTRTVFKVLLSFIEQCYTIENGQ